jgi:hypothetical protein
MNRGLVTVQQAYDEYKVGISGMASIESLNSQYKNLWRKFDDTASRNSVNQWYGRRMDLIRAIEKRVGAGESVQDVIAYYERMRGAGTLDKLQKALRKESIAEKATAKAAASLRPTSS